MYQVVSETGQNTSSNRDFIAACETARDQYESSGDHFEVTDGESSLWSTHCLLEEMEVVTTAAAVA
jgi:hypothetical protein